MMAVFKYNEISQILPFETLKTRETVSTIVAPPGGGKWHCFAEHVKRGKADKHHRPA